MQLIRSPENEFYGADFFFAVCQDVQKVPPLKEHGRSFTRARFFNNLFIAILPLCLCLTTDTF